MPRWNMQRGWGFYGGPGGRENWVNGPRWGSGGWAGRGVGFGPGVGFGLGRGWGMSPWCPYNKLSRNERTSYLKEVARRLDERKAYVENLIKSLEQSEENQ